MLVFIPSIGEFVIHELMCGLQTLMFGKILCQDLFINRDWLLALAVTIIMPDL